MKPRSIIGYGLGFLGVLIVVASAAAAFWLLFHDAHGVPLLLYFTTLVGAVLGWWGFYWADSRRSLEGGGFLVSAAERLRTTRTGRRDTDPVVTVADPVVTPVVEDRHPVSPEIPVAVPSVLLNPPSSPSD
jgi:hypothetical protein